ncbi:hypothetical protein CRE_08821 [Caenorhabditis remanei]|uniref:Uncharacterized protein n=1 Tax=Caenorhabditis remanei TaxID=31234 RepID=E3LHQ8_CAERE|nr:hypothetical protein CRE_08821 [Caenorhabditis remanei]
MFEDIYFWNKHGRPDAEKDQYVNSYCHQKLRELKTQSVLLKTYHLDSGEGECSKKIQEEMDRAVFSQDIAPYVRYSVNKRKRWETEKNVDTLGELQTMYDDMDVMILERRQFRSPPYICQIFFHNYFFERFPIYRVHQLKNNMYECTSVNSVRGQKIQHFSPENRSPTKAKKIETLPKIASRPKVVYHFITPPKNYEIFLQKRFHPGNINLKWWWPLEKVDLNLKKQVEEDLYEAITYDRLMDLEWDDVHEWDEDDYEEKDNESAKKCYNLEDHIVDKWVVVKRKRSHRGSTRS